MGGSDWTTPADVQAQVERLWERGDLLRPGGAGSPPFPWVARLRRPSSRELGERFGDVQDWVRALEEGGRRLGYVVEFEEIAHRQIGNNRVPARVTIGSLEEALRLVGKVRAAERYHRIRTEVAAEFPALEGWLRKRPLLALEIGDDWPRLLQVLRWFREHPRCGLFRRQLEIEGVHTKFIEERRKVLSELLPLVLPPEAVVDEVGSSFDRRFGLREKPPLIRFRLLDPAQHLRGLSDLTVPVSEFARLDLPVDDVIVTENEVNGLALPPRPRVMVVFGQGYANATLAEARWLGARRLRYWGDIDTHGFAILDRFRSHFSGAESMLMDRETFLAHRSLWVTEPAPCADGLARLTLDESALYEELVRGTHGERLRLEQERIDFGWVLRRL